MHEFTNDSTLEFSVLEEGSRPGVFRKTIKVVMRK
jgi:hypothetical protein